MDGFWPSTLAAWVTLIASVFAALWAVLTFARNNRIKAAETLLGVEKDYSRHIKTLLQLEYSNDYEHVFRGALKKAIQPTLGPYDKDESAAIDKLEDALRHFFVCANVRRLGVDAGAIDRLCAYYLRVLIDDRRPELRAYVRRYWPTVYYWAHLAGYPWPKRVIISIRQLPERVNTWWKGCFALPTLLVAEKGDSSNSPQNESTKHNRDKPTTRLKAH